MNTINLLPWRQRQTARTQKVMLSRMLLCLLSGALCAYMVSLVVQRRVSIVEEELQILSSKLARNHHQITEFEQLESDVNSMKKQLDELAHLKFQQQLPKYLIETMASTINSQVQLTEIDYEVAQTRVMGNALGYQAVNEFAKQLGRHSRVDQVQIGSVTQAPQANIYLFNLVLLLKEQEEK